ncbi:MAG: hypothetical protein ACSHX6_15055 [Akkermansiaceae bacterium]
MTKYQFYILRNLLSWVVVALFLMVALICENSGREFVGFIAICVAVLFLFGIVVRVFFYADADVKESLDDGVDGNDSEE